MTQSAIIDLRSDTVTLPTEAMLRAMLHAKVGDDIMGEDPTVKELETETARLLGKEAGLFLTSGTMANQVAVMSLTQRGDEVIAGDSSHIYNLECGGLAALSQTQVRAISTATPAYDLQEIEDAIRAKGIQNPRTGCICLENTKNLNAGLVVPLENLQAIKAIAVRHHLPVYLDGARIFNAAVASELSPATIAQTADVAMFALTKGLSAPFGAMLAGTKALIDEARWNKQRLGGGLRQGGYMAAAALVALRIYEPQVRQDNALAKAFALDLQGLGCLHYPIGMVHTNIVIGSVTPFGMPLDSFIQTLREKGVYVKPVGKDIFRMIVHRGIEQEQLSKVVDILSTMIRK